MIILKLHTALNRFLHSGNKIFLGNAGASFYNSGAMYDLLITDKTTNQQIVYDRLQEYTVGTNNGVRFL